MDLSLDDRRACSDSMGVEGGPNIGAESITAAMPEHEDIVPRVTATKRGACHTRTRYKISKSQVGTYGNALHPVVRD